MDEFEFETFQRLLVMFEDELRTDVFGTSEEMEAALSWARKMCRVLYVVSLVMYSRLGRDIKEEDQ